MTLQEQYPEYADIIDPESPREWLEQFFLEIAEMGKAYQGKVCFPPPCFRTMKARFVRYESRVRLIVRVPVSPGYLNPVGIMQGGFVTAAADNTLGPLSYMAARRPCSTIDLHTQFIRPISPGDILTIAGHVVSRGMSAMMLSAEITNAKGRTVAMVTANAAVVTV